MLHTTLSQRRNNIDLKHHLMAKVSGREASPFFFSCTCLSQNMCVVVVVVDEPWNSEFHCQGLSAASSQPEMAGRN